ncbi:MAG: NADH-quinone oxidoreductase subunit NuoF [Sedimentisphaerales bacterium]|nr:NADH-quinone oxidoreductase subunit NuoF [Sedimentisphaerales bacterium]
MAVVKKICSVNDLNEIRDSLELDTKKEQINVCIGGGCIASGSLEVKSAFEDALVKQGLEKKVSVLGTGCLGPCAHGPIVVIRKDNVFYKNVKPQDAVEIIEKHIIGGEVVERLLWKKEKEPKKGIPILDDIEFFKRQTKVVLRNCGRINPDSITDYIACDGYQALAKVLTSMKPDQVIEEMKKSGLRGRGGAGFPTWMKWSFARKTAGDTKYILCNGDEGDPGAFMDRSVLEGDPHSVIEGMAIGAFAIGASQGYVYVRAEYPLAVERLGRAIEEARKRGLLGKKIFGTDFAFDLEIRMGSGAFVCGEETALIASIEGKRGEPRPRPPFPAVRGLWNKPTVLNNVETFANVPVIILKSGDWLAKYGTEKSKGTKVFALAGAIVNSGLVEVPVGTTLGELIYDIGGGIPNGKEFKAAQIGGPSGGCIPKEHLNVPLDYESLNELGAIMGSGGLIVMDEDSCMVDVARFFLEFVQEESCGKCVPCRVGTKRMLEILTRICEGNGKESDIDTLIELGTQIKDTALCGLGQSAPNPVLSTIRYFRDEYEAHIREKHCPAGVCPGLVRAPCQSACPANVDVPGFVSLVAEKRYAEALQLHRNRNPFASICGRVCFHVCESKCRRAKLDSPVSVRGIKRFMADQEITFQLPEVRENAENAKRKVAIVGAGPAGLSCAYFLARLGYRPKVFEAERRPGGMLVQTIPSYRLPREIVAREIRMIQNMGVDIETGKRLGKDFTLSSLRKDGYEAIFVSVGSPEGVKMDIPGADAENVTDAISFLKNYNFKGSTPVGHKVVIIGGGNAAVDAARTAVRLGSKNVTIVYRRAIEDMPAFLEEIGEALNEGITIKALTNPDEIITTDGKVTGVKCHAMKPGKFDKTGRRRPEKAGQPFAIEADQVIFAIGQTLNSSELFTHDELQPVSGYKIMSDPITGRTTMPWLFCGGDAATGAMSVIHAVAGGEHAAVGIDEYLTGENHAFWRVHKMVNTHFDVNADPVTYPRVNMPLISVERRKDNFNEIEYPWVEAEAIRQAQRCLRCDYGKTIATETAERS